MFREDPVFHGLGVGGMGKGFLSEFVDFRSTVFAGLVLGFSNGRLQALHDVEFGVG